MIEKFTNDNRLKITILRLRDTSHYDGTNGKHILDSVFHVLDKFIEKYKEKYNFNTYNFNTKSIWSPKNEVRSESKYKHLINSDVIIIPTENEFQFHIKGRMSNNIFGRSCCRLLNILEGFDKEPDKKRKIIILSSDKADTKELFEKRTFNRSNYFVTEEGWNKINKKGEPKGPNSYFKHKEFPMPYHPTHKYNMKFERIDETDKEFPGGIHHLKNIFITTEVGAKTTPKEYDIVYWGTSKKEKIDESAESYEYEVKDYWDKCSFENLILDSTKYHPRNAELYRFTNRIKKGTPSEDFRNQILTDIHKDEEIKSFMIGYFDSFKEDKKFDKSIKNILPDISKGKVTLCFNWPGHEYSLTSRYNEAIACDVIPLVWDEYDKGNSLVLESGWQRVRSVKDLKQKLEDIKDENERQRILSEIKNKYYSVTKPIEYYEKEFEKKMLNCLDNSE